MDKKEPKRFFFICRECKYKEEILIDVDEYLEENLSSTGCCKTCGTKQWAVIDEHGYTVV